MNKDHERNKSVLINPLPVIMVVLLAAGVLIKTIPLESARPNDPERVKFVPTGEENVEARLWQDPFASIEKHKAQNSNKKDSPGQAELDDEKMSDIVKHHRQKNEVTVLAASVFGDSYAESAEMRRRTRFAVVSALDFHGYYPTDPGAIGYFKISQRSQKKSISDCNDTNDQKKLELIPFEWYVKKNKQSTSKVLLLWLNENLYSTDLILKELSRLFKELTMVGPAGSAMLLKLASDLELTSYETLEHACDETTEENSISMFSPTATITDCDLFGHEIQQQWKCFLKYDGRNNVSDSDLNELSKMLEKKGIVRTIGTDDVLAISLLWELWQRGVNRERSWPSQYYQNTEKLQESKKAVIEPCKDGLVLISEMDSAYARTLSRNLSDSFSEFCKDGPYKIPPVHTFNYFQGLDGALPSIDKKEAVKARRNDGNQGMDLQTQLEAISSEHSEGLSQYDYLRRLTSEIKRLDRDPKFAERGIKAIGIVGSDVYDKLLVLQALRSHFKNKIFFTTDLDARYLHADQKDWTRNLIVASNFDLTLHPLLQNSTPPFRDGYQTSTYLATLMALTPELSLDHWNNRLGMWLRPQLFEIGRTKAVFLASPSVNDLINWINGTNSEGISPIFQSAQCDDDWTKCEQIVRPVSLEKLSSDQFWIIIFVCILIGLWIMITSHHVQRGILMIFNSIKINRYSKISIEHFLIMVTTVIAVSACIYGVNQAMHATLAQGIGEPFIWLEGVSVWPNLIIRSLGLITMLMLFFFFIIRIKKQAQEIAEHFNLNRPSTCSLARSWFSAMWIGPYLDLASFDEEGKPKAVSTSDQIKVTVLWQNYLRATNWREMISWITLSLIIVFLLNVAAFNIFGLPSFPHRGELVKHVHYILLILTMPTLWLIIFWVGYEIRACTQLITALGDVRRQWPEKLLESEANKTGVSRSCLDHYLDFQLIVAATKRIQWLIYLPFISILFIVVARSELFDAMDFPFALILIVAVSLLYTLFTARLLRKKARTMRTRILAHYEQMQSRLTQPETQLQPEISVEQVNQMKRQIRNTREGAFAPFTQQPALQALLLPFGGFGGAELINYLFAL